MGKDAMAISRRQRLAGPAPFPATLHTQIAYAGAVLCVTSVAVAAAGASSDAAFGRGLLELLIVAVPIAAGLYALRAPANARFGVALLGIGFAWSFTALGESSASVPYTIGRLVTWLVFPCAWYLIAAFPTGQITSGLDRALFFGALAVSVLLFYGTAPLVSAYPPHTPWATCTTTCPANALFILDRQPAFLVQVVKVREWLVMLLWAGMFVSMYRRWRTASPLQRRATGPVFFVAVLLGLSHIAFHATRQLGAPANTVITLGSVWTFLIVALSAAFLFGLLRRRILLGDALGQLGVALRYGDDLRAVREALATALRDPTTEVLFREPQTGAWHTANGRPAEWPRPVDPGRAALTIERDGAAEDTVLIHDVALQDDPELLAGVSGMVVATWRHERLMSDLATAMSDLEESRRRIAQAADIERSRIERDIHDGAQQRLVGMRVRLGIAEKRLKEDPSGGVAEVRAIAFEAERALEDLRALAHGVYPTVLSGLGIPDALRSLGREALIRVRVESVGVTRHPVEIESAVYFTCAEALQNALKHAAGATMVWITLNESSTALRFEVRDDGAGFSGDVVSGRGLRNMHDRIEAIGGRLVMTSKPNQGTRVVGTLPLA